MGLLCIAGRTLGSARDGLASCCGSALGGLVHVAARAAGVSALVMASAQAFLALKLLDGAYLIYLGIQTWRSAGTFADPRTEATSASLWVALRQGATVEATNFKTAAFFLALLPQFIDPAQGAALQFTVLGAWSCPRQTGHVAGWDMARRHSLGER